MALSVIFPHIKALASTLVPQLAVGQKALGLMGFWWMVIVTTTTAMTTFNGGLFTASRFVYALAREKALPQGLARLNKYWVPANALLVLAGLSWFLALGVMMTGQYTVLINAGAGVEGLVYALCGLAGGLLAKTGGI